MQNPFEQERSHNKNNGSDLILITDLDARLPDTLRVLNSEMLPESILSDNVLIEAAAYVGEKIYSQPYTDFSGKAVPANFTYTCDDGTLIHRPNHNMANALRQLHYLKPTLQYLKYNGNKEVQNLLIEIDDEEIKKICFMQLFFTSGRKNEIGFSDNIQLANQARADAGKNFKDYFENKLDKNPFKDINEVTYYSHLLDKVYEYNPNNTNKDKALKLILLIAHELDCLRCSPEEKLQTSIIHTINTYSKTPNNRDLQKLLLYAQRCIIATGDMLRTQYQTQMIHGVHEETSFFPELKRTNRKLIYTGNNSVVLGCKSRDDALFKESSRVDEEGIKNTCNRLQNVVKPIFLSPNY